MTRIATPEERAGMSTEAVERYAAGDSIRAIAATLNRSFGFTRKLLIAADVQLRDKNWRAKAERGAR